MSMTGRAMGRLMLALALGIAAATHAMAQTREAAPADDKTPSQDAKGAWNPGQTAPAQPGNGSYNTGQSRPPVNNSSQSQPGRYPDFRSLIGSHSDAATQRMRDWGYRWAKTDGQGADTVKYFYSERDGGCAALQVRSDRVRDASPTDAGRCRQNKPTPGPSDPNWGKPLPREISGLVGNKRSDAESKLAALGFAKVDAKKTQGKTYGLWYNRYRYDCIEVEANDGRIRRIDRARRSACE